VGKNLDLDFYSCRPRRAHEATRSPALRVSERRIIHSRTRSSGFRHRMNQAHPDHRPRRGEHASSFLIISLPPKQRPRRRRPRRPPEHPWPRLVPRRSENATLAHQLSPVDWRPPADGGVAPVRRTRLSAFHQTTRRLASYGAGSSGTGATSRCDEQTRGDGYAPRRPEDTLLHALVSEHWPRARRSAEAQKRRSAEAQKRRSAGRLAEVRRGRVRCVSAMRDSGARSRPARLPRMRS
jgi:hypothetical protein